MCGFDAAIDKKGPALNGAGPFCFLRIGFEFLAAIHESTSS